jgi:hypothetical protein
MAILFHADDPILAPSDTSGRTSVLEGFEIGDYVGNPMYTVVDEHVLAAVLLVAAPLVLWLMARATAALARRGVSWASRLVDRYEAAGTRYRLAAWAVWLSALIHTTLVFTHEVSWYTLLYAIGSVALGWAAWALLGPKRRLASAIIVGSVVTFWVFGAPPDQVGLATKLIELFALALVAFPVVEPSRWRRLAGAGVVSLIVLSGLAGWVGAFATVGEDGGHHGGEYPDPGTLVPYIERLEPTAEEQHFASDIYWETYAAIEKYRDPAVAEADGYQVGVVYGLDHHANNPAYLNDGRVLDPERPESLIYAESAAGPVLVGVMFETDGIGNVGPTSGGPLMLWHSHEKVCLSLLPPGLAGLESPFGSCPIGAINLPITGEMLHGWMIPGVADEDKWGHLEDGWLEDYIEQVEAAG